MSRKRRFERINEKNIKQNKFNSLCKQFENDFESERSVEMDSQSDKNKLFTILCRQLVVNNSENEEQDLFGDVGPIEEENEDQDLFGDVGSIEEENGDQEQIEKETDCPKTNLERIFSYLNKEGEHRINEFIGVETTNPKIFGFNLESIPIPSSNKIELGEFLKKINKLNREIKADENFDKIVNEESGLAAVLNIPKNAIPKLSNFFYCLNHVNQ